MSSTVAASLRSSSLPATSRGYWVATGALCALFIFSGVWELVDLDAAKQTFRDLGYPDRLAAFSAVAKLLAVATILWARSRTLTFFAFAGLLYDMLLALSGHIATSDPNVVLAIAGIFIWSWAFYADQRRFGPPRTG